MDFYNTLEDDEWKSQELLQMTAFFFSSYVLYLCILWTGLGISMS